VLSLTLLFFCSLTLSLLLTPLCRNVARRLGVMDAPGERRKVHKRPIPRIGGIPILAAYVGALVALMLTPSSGGSRVTEGLPAAWPLLPSVFLVFLTGLLDDLFALRPWQKLAGEILAGGLACTAGVRINGLAGLQVPGWWAVPLTILWLVGCANAVNLIDGLDGLAAGVAFFATLTTFIAGLLQSNFPLALATAPLAGALLGFLCYNFNPASIFLGDSGSLVLGFLLGCYGVIWSLKSATLLGMTAPLMALAIPLLDTTLAIARRALRGQPIFAADRRHIHHLLLDRGLTPRRAALLLYAVCGVAAALSVLLSVLHRQYDGWIIFLFCAATWIGIHRLGYIEFNIAGRLIRPSTFRGILDAQLRLSALEDSLKSAVTVDDCWIALRGASSDLGFDHLSARLDHTVQKESFTGPASLTHAWTLHIPLSDTEFVQFARDFDHPLSPMVVASLADLVRRTLEPKLPAFNHVACGAQASPSGNSAMRGTRETGVPA
jgi:UDP-GlcNAc:undecaprenyl-phosphate GlcNAc-1-phosphate transferase